MSELEHYVHHVHQEHHSAEFSRRLMVATPLTAFLYLAERTAILPILVGDLLVLGASTVMLVYCSYPFLSGAVAEVRKRLPGMMTLVGMAVLVAYTYGIYSFIAGKGAPLLAELGLLVTVMLFGHMIEGESAARASSAIEKLLRLLPSKALRVVGGRVEEVPVEALKPGDIVLIKPGDRIPADGVVVEGRSDIDLSLITGESVPVPMGEGDWVIGGALNLTGSLKVRIARAGKDTYIAQIVSLLRRIQEAKSRIQTVADRAAMVLTFLTLGVGIITFLLWILSGADFGFSIERMVSVLVVSCPHALGLGIPLVSAVAGLKAAEMGLVIKNKSAFERAWRAEVVLFDKTGTLTEGEFEVVEVATVDGVDKNWLLKVAASAEAKSEHPIAKAIVREAERNGIGLIPSADFRAIPGVGVEALVDGHKVMVVGEPYVKHGAEELPATSKAGTRVYVIVDGSVIGCLVLRDRIKPEAEEAVRALRRMGKEVIIVSGDSEEATREVALHLGVDYYSGMTPDEKAEVVRKLRNEGKVVVMVGDGINDAVAISSADTGIAIGAGTDIAVESADVVLVRSDPRDVVKVMELSRKTYVKMLENIAWAVWYNAIAIPAAAGALAFLGIVLSPALSAVLMTVSDIVVMANSAHFYASTKVEKGKKGGKAGAQG